jgi:hypothetical protein
MFALGRTAFYYGLIKISLDKSNKILLPNYICKSVLVPIVKLNFNYCYYSINNNFKPNFEDIKKKINPGDYLLIVHYFGQVQNLTRILKFCKKNNIKLIEDNAHGYSGEFKKKKLGTFGEIGFSSPRKILNILTGGILYFQSKIYNISLPSYKLTNFDYFKSYLFNFKKIRNLLKKIYHFLNLNKKYDNKFLNNTADSKSSAHFKKVDWKLISKKRRDRWKKLVKYFTNNDCHPIWNKPNEKSCPWVIPFKAKNIFYRDKIIDWGKKNNLNIITWPNLPKHQDRQHYEFCNKIWKKIFCIELNDSVDLFFKINSKKKYIFSN